MHLVGDGGWKGILARGSNITVYLETWRVQVPLS